jgi:hypothetical protein
MLMQRCIKAKAKGVKAWKHLIWCMVSSIVCKTQCITFAGYRANAKPGHQPIVSLYTVEFSLHFEAWFVGSILAARFSLASQVNFILKPQKKTGLITWLVGGSGKPPRTWQAAILRSQNPFVDEC